MPFVQGHLRNEPLSVRIHSECACCGSPLELEIDSELRHRVLAGGEPGQEPLILLPLVDFDELNAPSIIDDF